MMISTYDFETLRYYNPRFWHKNIPFDLMTHVETLVCLARKA